MSGWLARCRVPGVAIAVVRHGELAWIREYGLANQAEGDAREMVGCVPRW